MNVKISIYIDGECVSVQVCPLDWTYHVPLLGQEISKDARHPTDMTVKIERIV